MKICWPDKLALPKSGYSKTKKNPSVRITKIVKIIEIIRLTIIYIRSIMIIIRTIMLIITLTITTLI